MTNLTPHRGVLVLVLGIVALVVCQPIGIAAWIMGNNDLREIDAGRMDPEGRSLTQIGRILGIIGVVLFVLGVIATIAMFALGIGMAARQ